MKNPKISILAIVTAVAVNIITVLCGIMIWQCEDMLCTLTNMQMHHSSTLHNTTSGVIIRKSII